MDMTFEAAPMGAAVVLVTAFVKAKTVIIHKAYALIERIATVACPSIAGHSLSAVAPDYALIGGTA